MVIQCLLDVSPVNDSNNSDSRRARPSRFICYTRQLRETVPNSRTEDHIPYHLRIHSKSLEKRPRIRTEPFGKTVHWDYIWRLAFENNKLRAFLQAFGHLLILWQEKGRKRITFLGKKKHWQQKWHLSYRCHNFRFMAIFTMNFRTLVPTTIVNVFGKGGKFHIVAS